VGGKEMLLQEIEKFYETKDLNGLVTEMSHVFNEVDDLQDAFIEQNIHTNIHLCRENLSKLTGYCMYLNTVFSIAEAHLRSEESKKFNSKRIEMERNAGKKFIASSVEKEVAAEVSDYRRIRNVLEAYYEKCRTGISTCQSIIRSLTEEYKHNEPSERS
jgi:hypothetical protein